MDTWDHEHSKWAVVAKPLSTVYWVHRKKTCLLHLHVKHSSSFILTTIIYTNSWWVWIWLTKTMCTFCFCQPLSFLPLWNFSIRHSTGPLLPLNQPNKSIMCSAVSACPQADERIQSVQKLRLNSGATWPKLCCSTAEAFRFFRNNTSALMCVCPDANECGCACPSVRAPY